MSTVLVPLDFSEHSLNALHCVMQMKDKLKAEIALGYVKPSNFFKSFLGSASEKQQLEDEVQEKLKHLKTQYGYDFEFHESEGAIYKNVVQMAEQIEAEMIIMGTHGHSGFEEFWIGGNAYKTVSAAPCPVITMRESFMKDRFDNIVLPIDQSEHTRQKVPFTTDLAQRFGATVHVTGICTDSDDDTVIRMRQYTHQVLDFLEEHEVSAKHDLLFGSNITEKTLEYAQENNADLVTIMTEQELNPSNLIMGAFAQQMVNHSPIPVLSLRPNPRYAGRIAY